MAEFFKNFLILASQALMLAIVTLFLVLLVGLIMSCVEKLVKPPTPTRKAIRRVEAAQRRAKLQRLFRALLDQI